MELTNDAESPAISALPSGAKGLLPPACVTPWSHTSGMLPRRALTGAKIPLAKCLGYCFTDPTRSIPSLPSS